MHPRESLAGLLELLAPYGPAVVGSTPLGLQIPGSDIDIACEAADLDELDRVLVAAFQPFIVQSWRRPTIPAASVTTLRLAGMLVEVFAQPLPVIEQTGFRHMIIEGQLLRVFGGPLRAEVFRLKRDEGLGTEPAFAQALGLADTDPYQALLRLEGLSDAELSELAR